MRWVGIDEAGYGPNLGPLVMTAVVAELSEPGRADARADAATNLDFWADLAGTVDRAGGDRGRLWVDDSKAILRGGHGRDRLEAACLAAVHAAGQGLPESLAALVAALGDGTIEEAELSPWFDAEGRAARWPWGCSPEMAEQGLARRPLEPAGGIWRLTAIESVVVGPARFNAELASASSKAEVHFAAFARLLH